MKYLKYKKFTLGLFVFFLFLTETKGQFKTERPPYEDFLNYGVKKLKSEKSLENEIIKSKVDVLGDVFKHHVNRLRKSPGQVVELVFLVDSSASVGAENFFNELKFVKKLLADFTVSFNQTRVAVITFSSKSKVIRHIDHVTQSSPSNHKCSLLERELPQIGYSGGGTFTLGALMEAQSVLALSRPDAVKAVFLVTDGYSNGGDPRPAAEFLKSRGVIVFTFGIQNGNVKELYDMATEPKEEHSYILNSFEEFEALARRALHEDLHSGGMIAQDSAACSTLCEERDNCCDEFARCTCGIHTGHYACTCRIGYYGTGLRGDCKPCPSGTYRDIEGPSDITGCKACPDKNMLSPEGSTSPNQCYCNRGYVQDGLECQRLKCSPLTPPPNGYFVRGSCERAVNAACGIRCRPGYTLVGSSIRLCREDGSWSGGDAMCVMKNCKILKIPKNGNMICSSESASIDTQCHFTCKPGYQLVGSRMRTCLPVAMWDGIRAYCKPIFCEPLPPNPNGMIKPESCTIGKIKYGTRCEFGCNIGFEMSGPLKTSCTDKGKWSEGYEKARCIDVDPPIIKCPRNLEVETEPNENYALVSWEPPFVKDSSNGKVSITTVPATKQPMRLKIGRHSIALEAKDEWGNKAKCIFIVKVKDKEPPRVDRCESPPTFLSRDSEVDVYWEEPIFSDNSGASVQVYRSKEPGRFSQGKTIVEYVAADLFGNSASCNITINVQQHACELPLDPINGVANCSESPDAVYCSLTCQEGYAFAMRPSQDYFCSYNGIWLPDSNPLPFPDCSVSSISNTITHSGEIAMEERDGSVCDDIFFMGQVENKIQVKLEEALRKVCADDLCEIETVEAICEGLLSEAEEEFNSISFTRKKRYVDEKDYLLRLWPDEDFENWLYWKRGDPLNFQSYGRTKRDTSKHLISKKQFGFPKAIFNDKEVNETLFKRKDNDANFMGVLTSLIVQSLGKDIGMTRFSSFLTNLGSKDGSFGVKDFIAAFAKEFGEEKAKDVRTLAEKRLGPFLQNDIFGREYSIERGLHFSSSSASHFGGSIQIMDNQTQDLISPMSMAYKSSLLQHADDGSFKISDIGQAYSSLSTQDQLQNPKGIKVKFQVEGHGNKASDAITAAFKDLLKSAQQGQFDIDFGEHQLRVAAIRLSEDPEYKCDPGSVLIDQFCVKCPVGTFFNVIMKECQSCPHGSYQPEEGQVSCLVCPENTSTKVGQAKSGEDCKAMCLPGSYSSDTLEPCITCPLGEYQDEYASSSCSPCPYGTTTWRRGSWLISECKSPCEEGFVSETGLEPCLPCPLNYFQDKGGQKECFRCPGESYTTNSNSSSLYDCVGISEDSKAAYTSFEKLGINDCFSSPCVNGGSCVSLESGYVCNCPFGITGQHCESEINECLSFPCHNNGTCLDQLGTFSCNCSSGFEGDFCDININECEPNPCHNNAICVDQIAAFKCLCESGFTGETCETNIDECELAGCSESSSCIDGISDYTCLCQPGFEGRHCNEEIDECNSSPCIHGSCIDLVNDFSCSCEAGYKGKTCSEDIDDCFGNPCQNNATCNDWINGFSCKCKPGFSGKTCETKMSTDFFLEFATSGIINYASTETLPRKLNEVSVCFWMKTKDHENYGTPFSYATEEHDNALTLTDYSGFVFYVNGEKKITDVSATDGKWHMICVIWNSKGGKWAIFKDGIQLDSGEGLSKDKVIEEKGVFVIGQEQDEKGGKYSAPESFIGSLQLLNVWDEALSPDKIATFYTQCDRYDGNVWSWPDFQSGIMGDVTIQSSTFCRGCGFPYIPKHAKIVSNGSETGEIIKIECEEGYKLYEGNGERMCLVHGQWSGVESECKPVSCGFPGQVRNGEIKGFGYYFGDQVFMACKKGFKLLGSATRTCMADGKWSGDEPECQIIECPSPLAMENGVLVSRLGSYLPTNKVAYSCEQGYQMDGPAYQTCGSSGEWEGDAPSCQPKHCNQLPIISHGTVIKTSNDDVITANITCDFGYQIHGSAVIICQKNGEWSTPFPKCQKVKCPKPPPVDNGVVMIRVSLEGKQAKYKCDIGYNVVGKKFLTCNDEGMWNTNDWSKCIIQKCPTPEIPFHGKAPLEENWVIGDKFKYQCKTGYFVKGNDVKVCSPGKKEGIWEGETPVCEAISCPALPSIVGGSFSVIQNGLKTEEETPYSVYDEVELISRRRRSAFDSGFPSPLGQSSNYDELEDFGQSPSQQIHFPGQTPNPTYEDFGQVSQSFDGFDDFTGQTSDGFDFDYGGQTNEGFDYIGQTSDGFDNIGQSPDGLDVFSQFPNYEEGGQSQGSDLDYSQIPDSFTIDTFSLDSIVEYSCRPGYKLIGSPKRRCSENGEWDQPEPICYEQHCQELKPLVNGRLSYFGSGSSSRVEFSCNEGYQLKGDFEIVCQNDRTWLGDIPYCERLSCETPVEPENGTVEYTSTTFGSLATYDCFQGFVLEGSFTRHCGADGFWNGSTPRCIGVVCKTPSVIDKGYIYYEGNLNVGSIVEYGCNECYKLVGNAVRECQLDETWTLEEPRCDLIMCSTPPSSLQNGKVIGTSNSCGSLVEFECNPGYIMNGQRKASCMEDGEWTHPVPECEKVSCDSPPKLLNGKILGNSFKFSDQIIYECNEGYNINGNNILTCDENGNWIGDVPSCLIINCTKPKGPSNGRVRVNGLFYGASVNVVCDPGYKIEGESKLTCQANAQWDKEMPFCSPLICPPAPRPPHSSYNSSELYFESFTHLEYKCDLGFITKIRNKILQCSSQAIWKGELIDCKPVDCGKPKNLKHGIIDGDKYTFGHIIDFSCFEGYKLIGEPKATCQSNGKWTDMPTCERITCGSPPLTPFGNVVMDKPEGDFNSSVHYECHRGYVLNGFPKIICKKSGEWSSLAPRCDPVLCPEPPEELNAVISGNVYEFDKNITYQCNEGFSMQGISTLTCLENGKWSSDFPVCDMITCEVPIEVPNAKWETKKLSEVPVRTEPLSAYKSFKGKKVRQRTKTSKTSKLTALLENQYESEHLLYRFGHIIEYTCNEGHFKTTTGILECSELGWSTTPPQCHPITCPQPISIKNGRVIGDDVKFGSILKYECDEGYDLFGVSSRKCQANKEWTDIEPYCRPKECPRPAQLINGRTIVKSIKYQSVISYACDPGFRLEGHQTRVCQSDENWSGERPFCIEIFCEEPEKISHGVTDITSLKVGGQANFVCMEGYRMEGRSIINCQSDGEWDSVPPKCLRVNCGPPPGGSHLNMSFDSTFYASKVTYFCERGYRLEGNSVTTCLQSGQWSNKVPHCSIVTCDVLPEPSNGFIIKNNDKKVGEVYRVDDEITYACHPGWKVVGDEILTCSDNGKWSSDPPKCKRISCGAPSVPKHAKYIGNNFLFEGVVEFSCEKGHILRGNPVIKCSENGSWSSNSTKCVPVKCGEPPDPSNSHVSYQIPEHGFHHHFGSVVTYACDDGYLLEGSLYMTCESSGKWIGPREAPTCVEMLCGDPPILSNAKALQVKDSYPQIVSYKCDRGYVLNGNDTIHCRLGMWKGLSASCTPVNCYEPPIPLYGQITAKHFTFRSIANYSCALGYELNGNPSVECGSEGKWIGGTPECNPIDCGEPESPPNGKVSYQSSLFNHKSSFSCNKGYELKGDKYRTCNPEGSWSGHLPQCHRVSCGELHPPERGFIIGVGDLFGDKVVFSCEKGHVLIGNGTSICQSDGTWSITNPKCEGVKCGEPPFIRNGKLSSNVKQKIYVFGDKILYTCQEGHLPRGDLSSLCLKDGTWSDVKGQCSKISCGRPKINKDGAVLLGRSFYYNDKVKISCPSGTKPKGSTLLTCLSDGSWSGEPSCISDCNNVCLNGGVCLNDNICSCPTGFMGNRCQHATCILPCLNGGSCVGPYTCKCPEGFEGRRCQRPICEKSCEPYGKCIGPNVCLCKSGETSESCPEFSDYDYFTQEQISTHFNDWDIAALTSRKQQRTYPQ